MGFNKLMVPDLKRLEEQLSEIGEAEFIKYWTRRYSKSDAIIGSSKSCDFIDQFLLKEHEDISSNNK